MTQDDALKQFKALEANAASGLSYTNHYEIDLREVWKARRLGLPDPEWKPVGKRCVLPNNGRAGSLSKEQIDLIVSSNGTNESIAQLLNIGVSTVQYHRKKHRRQD